MNNTTLADRFIALAAHCGDAGKAGAFRNVADALRGKTTTRAALRLAREGAEQGDDGLWGGEMGTPKYAAWITYRNGFRAGYADAIALINLLHI